jgi:hypothetical protein
LIVIAAVVLSSGTAAALPSAAQAEPKTPPAGQAHYADEALRAPGADQCGKEVKSRKGAW